MYYFIGGAYYYLLDDQGTRHDLLPTKISYTGSLHSSMMHLKIEQHYQNDTGKLQSLYYYIPSNCTSIFNLSFLIDEKPIDIAIQEKEIAKNTFYEAIRTNKSAILGQYLHNGSTEMIIGNASPNSKVKIKFDFVSIGSIYQNQIHFHLPLSVALSLNNQMAHFNSFAHFDFTCLLSINYDDIIDVCSNGLLFEFNTNTHIFTSQSLKGTSSDLSSNLTVTLKSPFKSEALISNRFAALTIVPPLENPTRIWEGNSDYIFLIDRSRSMCGPRKEPA